MSTIPGVFNETAILTAKHLADKMMLDDRIRQQFIPDYDVYKYLRSLHTATVNTAFGAKKKDYDVEISWVNACSSFDREDISCEVGGDELSTNVEEYSLQHRFVKGFTVRDDVMRSNDYETRELIAKGLLKIDKEIAEDFSQLLVGRLNLFAGTTVIPDQAGITTVGNLTTIDPALWIPSLIAYFERTRIMNRFTAPAMISGNNLFESLYVAEANKVNANDKGDHILWGRFPFYFDLANIDFVNNPDFLTYMVSMGAVALASKTWYPDQPQTSFDAMRYTMKSRFLEGFSYDVTYTNNCIAEADIHEARPANRDTLAHHWKVVLTADCFLNPVGCVEGNTGVLRFRNA